MKYQDSLWDELPEFAWKYIPQQGCTKQSLRQCYRSPCTNQNPPTIHILKKTVESEEPATVPIKIEYEKYWIYCEACQNQFVLIIERKFDKESLADHNSDDYLKGIGPIQIYAKGIHNEVYADIGWISK